MSQIAVIGAGLMGHGIALTMARAGHSVMLFDPIDEARRSAMARIEESLTGLGEAREAITGILSRITLQDNVRAAVENADFVFEAAPEKLSLKQQIFSEVERFVPERTILASNTSVIQITKIMSGLRHQGRTLGTHWWNPPHLIPLVEVIRTDQSDDSCIEAMCQLLDEAGKLPVRVEKDIPGFIGNRLQHALWREAISLVEKGVCNAEAVDDVIKASFGRRLSVLGPLENADLVGTDLTLDIQENILFDLEDRTSPSPYLERLVQQQKLGMKSGEGFRKWTPDEANAVRNGVVFHLKKLQSLLEEEQAETPIKREGR